MPGKSKQSNETPLLLGFIIKKIGADGKPYIEFQWLRISILLISSILFLWLSLATLLFAFFKYSKGYDTVSYKDMLILPLKYSEHQKEMGNFHIEKGLLALEKENYAEGVNLLRNGLARAPDNLIGRTQLAQIYEFWLKRTDVSIEMYQKGFEFGGIYDEAFLTAALRSLLANKMDKEIEDIADEYLPNDFQSEDNKNYQMLAYAAATSAFLKGNFDNAEDYINLYLLNTSVDGIILSSKISWDRGNQLSAINKLESSLFNYPGSDQLYAQLSLYYRETGDFDSARRYAKLRNIKNPLKAAPLIDLIYLYHEFEKEEKIETLSQRILLDFKEDEGAILGLANFSSVTGNIKLAQQCYELALEKDFALGNLALSLIEAYLLAGDYEGATKFSEELLVENPKWLIDQMAVFSSLRALSSFGLNRPDLGEIYLGEFLNEPNIKSSSYVAVAKRFSANKMYEQAQKILQEAYQKDRKNQRILNDLIKVNLVLGHTENLGTQLRTLLTTRRPDTDLLKEAYQRLGSDLFLFAKNRNSIILELGAILREKSL